MNPATANSATYSYILNSPLAGTIQFKQAASLRMTTMRQYDKLNRLSSVESVGTLATTTGVSPLSHAYLYNDANQRVKATQFDGSQWAYDYDKLGQVISGKKYWSDGTPVAGQQFEYAFDDIGNRTSTKVGGNSSGTGLRSASYTVNALNQYTQRGVPNALDVLGLVKGTTASVTINSSPADHRRGEYFQETLSVANSAQAVWQSVTVDSGVPADVKTGNIFVPKTPDIFDDASTPTVNEGYDLDRNQLRDGRWTYTWDAENRLVRMVANTLIGPQQRIDFEYDWQGRRIRMKVWNNVTGTDPVALDQKFVYDGWNLIAILAADNSRVQSFTWGYDLSGTLQGAGGVGGLKALTVHIGPEAGTYFCAYDGNGNVVGLVNAANGGIAAQYEYGPFGEIIRATGPMAKVNPFRFSTKYQDDETDLLYYGHRYYSASNGRWLTRDPLQEVGSTCLYTAAWNDLLNAVDVDGRYGWSDLRNDASGIQAVMVDNWNQFRNWGVNNWRQARPRVADATQRALGTIDNVVFFYDWIFERGDELRSYKDGDRLVELLKRSRGIEKALSRYKEAGCPQALRGNYGTMEGYRDVTLGGEFLNPAHFQIGGYIWDIEKLGSEKVKIKIVNHASRRSLVGEPTARQIFTRAKTSVERRVNPGIEEANRFLPWELPYLDIPVWDPWPIHKRDEVWFGGSIEQRFEFTMPNPCCLEKKVQSK